MCFLVLSLAFCLDFSTADSQVPSTPGEAKPAGGKPDYSSEAFVTELDSTRIVFENDGTSTRQSTARIRIQSDAGVQRYGVLTFRYQNSTESADIDYVRVRKQDGSIISTWHWHTTKPLAPGQFWFAYNFSHDGIILQEQLQIGIPRNRPVKWKSSSLKPVLTEDSASRFFTWTSSHLEAKSTEEEKKDQEQTQYQAARGKLPAPEIQLSSFQSWEEVGGWYTSLQRERVKPTAEIRTKAAELTKGSADDAARLHAIYNYVGTQFRYIGIAFGIGRYQPHSAADVLNNQYGDCKDKHTLFASLLGAVGLKAYPALIASTHEIDVDVPSPAQFDHVISVVAQGDHFIWLDTTPEVAPFAYLSSGLRDKQALVMAEDKLPTLIMTPADPPLKPSQVFRIDAKLSDTGTLQGKIARSVQGDDNEVALGIAFRRVPLPKWKDLIQQISYLSGFAGDVSDVTAGSPEKIDEAFHFAYTYTRKDYPDWSDRRISSPLPPIMLPPVQEKDGKPSFPIWLGSPTDVHLESHVELPKGYSPELPKNVDLKEDFAEYHATYAIKDGMLLTQRAFLVKLREVPVSKYELYKKFSKVVENDHNLYIALSSGKSSPMSYQDGIWNLPYSDNPEAVRAYDEARNGYERHDLQAEITSLKRAVEIDPKFTRAWLWLGEIYMFARQPEQALQAYRKAVNVDPQEALSYKALGFALVGLRKFDEAIPVWQELIKIAPNDSGGSAGLGISLFGLKRYGEAASALETAVKLSPQFAGLEVQLGSAFLRAGEEDKALAAYQKAIELDPSPWMFNNVGYELADGNKKLPIALEYAEKAVGQEEEASQKLKLSELGIEDLAHTSSLAAFWDTLGWVHFRMGNLDQAEKYLKSAWELSQDWAEADHLGQLYERQHKKQAAARMYRLALYRFPQQANREPEEMEKTRARLQHLFPGSAPVNLRSDTEASTEVNRLRTIKLTRLTPGTESAEVFVVFAPDPKSSFLRIEDVKFISGSEKLKSAGTALKSATFQIPFSFGGHARLLRRGILGCYQYSGCSLTLLNPADVHSVN
ncbi:MAG: hypothetical protein AUI17_03065 [Acidobacteriales bacterium 13_2_20CM_2_55_5]|nr:MAG: hypothetical protein AUI17_03065 [Acidobacteriales bacterium 13_2_20CM_2_55_5]